jgi:hypothetical protein
LNGEFSPELNFKLFGNVFSGIMIVLAVANWQIFQRNHDVALHLLVVQGDFVQFLIVAIHLVIGNAILLDLGCGKEEPILITAVVSHGGLSTARLHPIMVKLVQDS